MVSTRDVVPAEARARALAVLEEVGQAPFEAWQRDWAVAELRWMSGGLVSVLRTSVDVTVREFAATADPATGLAAVHLLQALVLGVLDDAA